MRDEQVLQSISEGLLAYFRSGTSVSEVPLGNIAFAGTLRLLQLHWAIGRDMRELLEYFLQRHGEMISSPTTRLLETQSAIRGTGNWPSTIIRRQVTGNPHVTVYRNVRRSFDTGPNKVLLFVISNALRVLETISRRADLIGSPYGESIRRNTELAVRAQRAIELRQLRGAPSGRVPPRPSAKDVQMALHSPRRIYILAARQMQLLLEMANSGSRSFIDITVGELVAPLRSWQRFELFALLHIGLALGSELGLKPKLNDLSGAMAGPAIEVGPFDVYWGVNPRSSPYSMQLPAEREIVQRLLTAFGLVSYRGRPDITVVNRQDSEVISIVECKCASIDSASLTGQFRDAVRQLVEYSADFRGGFERRLGASAIAMRTLPRVIKAADAGDGAALPTALDATDLLERTTRMQHWAAKICELQSD